MTSGVGTFIPQPRFTFPRSYVTEVYNASAGFLLTQNYNQFTLDFHPTFSSVYHWTFDERFWVWTSNAWTLDFIITESYYQNSPGGTKFPLDFTLSWARDSVSHKSHLLFAPNHSVVSPVKADFVDYSDHYWAPPT